MMKRDQGDFNPSLSDDGYVSSGSRSQVILVCAVAQRVELA